MEYLVRDYGIQEFHIADDCFSWDEKRVRDICGAILSRKLKVAWACSNGIRVDRGNRELFGLMKRAGCYRVAFGVESGDPEILSQIAKKINLDQVREAFSCAQQAGLITIALFMLGNRGETKGTMERTITFAKTLKTDYAQFAIAVPYPGTPLYAYIEKHGRFLTREWPRYGIFGEPVVFEAGGITKELLLSMHRRAYREFYFRPGQIIFMLFKRVKYASIRDADQILDACLKVLSRAFSRKTG
jgi:radical SAM superfamily enzyme YgiQ (UPF0313 family)